MDPPGPEDRNEYLIGTVAVTLILPESDGTIDTESETWTAQRMDNVYNEINVGLNWWESRMPNGRLEFTVYTLGQQTTSYEPITRATSDQWRWVSEIMNNLGYTSGDYIQDVMDLNNDVRNTYGKDWSYTAFIVDSYNDDDGTFTDGASGYAFGMGGPFMVMTYDNNGWGITNMDKVMAHETGHMFYATDEYTRPGEWSGYLNVLEVTGSGCLMDTASWCLSSGTLGQIGWRDSDGDGIMDPEDTIPDTTLVPQTTNPTTNNILTYTGTAEEIALTNQNPFYNSWLGGHRVNAGNDVSINLITNVQYRVDGGTWLSATPLDGAFDEAIEDYAFTTAALPDGTLTIETRAVNTVGNWDDTYASDVVVVDTTPPTTSVVVDGSPGTNGWYRSNVTVTLIGSDATTGVQYTRYKTNGGGWQTYTGPFPVNGDGIITLDYYSVDNLDLVESAKNLEIKIDKANPTTSEGVSGTLGASGYFTSDVNVTLTATDLLSGVQETRYSIDGGAFKTYSGTFVLTGDWTHSVLYYSIDVAGNTEAMNSFDVMIDATNPITGKTLSGALGNNNWHVSFVTITLNPMDSASGVELTKYRVDGGSWVDYVGAFLVSGDGQHDVDFYSIDHAGNVEELNAILVRIDTSAPITDDTLSGTLGTNGWYTSDIGFTLAGSDVISGVSDIQYRIDGLSWLTYVGSFLVSGEGPHIIEFFSEDVAGNTETIQTVQVKIDTKAPATVGDLTGLMGSGTWYTSDVTFLLIGSDDMSGVLKTKYRVDGGVWHTYSGSFSIDSDGTHTIEFYSVDNASNQEGTISIVVKIDATAPSTTETLTGSEGTNGWFIGDVTITLAGSDETSGVRYTEYRVDGGTWLNHTGTIPIIGDGEFTIEFHTIDMAGNVEGTKTLQIRIDKTTPNIDTLAIRGADGDSILTTSSAEIQWTGSDELSGIDHYEVKIDNGGFAETGLPQTKEFTNLGDGTHTVTVKAVDRAGNSWERSISFTTDTNPLSPTGPAGGLLLYLLIMVAAVVLALVLLLWRRRKKEEPEELRPKKPGSQG